MHDQVGKMITYHRKKLGLSQKHLADRAGVGKTVIFDIEHGKPSVQFNTLLKILSALDVRLLFRTNSLDIEFKESI